MIAAAMKLVTSYSREPEFFLTDQPEAFRRLSLIKPPVDLEML